MTGLRVYRSFRGRVDCPIEWQWCLQVSWRSPYSRVLGWMWPWGWLTHYFYFGRTHKMSPETILTYGELRDYTEYLKQIIAYVKSSNNSRP